MGSRPSKLHVLALAVVGASWTVPDRARPAVLRALGVRLAPGVTVSSGVRLISNDLSIGPRSFINVHCLIDSSGAAVDIGADVDIAPGVAITTHTHEHGTQARRAGRPVSAPVRVGDGTWIGLGATILPGVSIGDGCVVAAGAVVIGDCDPHGLYAGLPARRIRDLPVGDGGDAPAAAPPV